MYHMLYANCRVSCLMYCIMWKSMFIHRYCIADDIYMIDV